jgi:hypothetical protein
MHNDIFELESKNFTVVVQIVRSLISYASEEIFAILYTAKNDVELGRLLTLILILISLSNLIHSLLFAECSGIGYEKLRLSIAVK